jgi:hypothetical protein
MRDSAANSWLFVINFVAQKLHNAHLDRPCVQFLAECAIPAVQLRNILDSPHLFSHFSAASTKDATKYGIDTSLVKKNVLQDMTHLARAFMTRDLEEIFKYVDQVSLSCLPGCLAMVFVMH